MAYPISKCQYPADVARIIHVAAAHGVVLSALEAEKAWDDYSESLCAGWIILPESDDEIWSCLPGWATGETT